MFYIGFIVAYNNTETTMFENEWKFTEVVQSGTVNTQYVWVEISQLWQR